MFAIDIYFNVNLMSLVYVIHKNIQYVIYSFQYIWNCFMKTVVGYNRLQREGFDWKYLYDLMTLLLTFSFKQTSFNKRVKSCEQSGLEEESKEYIGRNSILLAILIHIQVYDSKLGVWVWSQVFLPVVW